MVLCSADASPRAQKVEPGQAQDFYPRGKWVGAIRNTAARLTCDFLILTTKHGLVEPHQIITPYDLHINEYRQEVTKIWMETIPSLIQGAHYKLMIFYAGGCPDETVEVALPILKQMGVALLTFGKPNMFDVNKVEPIWSMLMNGTTDEEIKSVLKVPDRFRYYPVDNLLTDRA
jgi:hypothetical protein